MSTFEGMPHLVALQMSSYFCFFFLLLLLMDTSLENLCTRKVQSSRGGCSRRVHKIVYLAV